jgi:hypothetical protein
MKGFDEWSFERRSPGDRKAPSLVEGLAVTGARIALVRVVLTWVALSALGLAPGLADFAAGQTTPVSGVDTQVDPGALSGFAVSVAPHTQGVLGGEAFESLKRGIGLSVAFAALFERRYSVGLRASVTRNREGSSLYDDRTHTLDAWLELRRIWTVASFRLAAGPTVGFARMSRPMYLEPIRGFLAGLGVGAERSIVGGFGVAVGADATWTSFNAPPVAIPAPLGWDNDADGTRLSVSLGLTYRWSRR